MISSREVQHIAKLARISLRDEEILQLQKDLASILEYFDMLRDIDVVSSTNGAEIPVLPLSNVSRDDAARASDLNAVKRLLEMVPEAKSGYVKVKSIL